MKQDFVIYTRMLEVHLWLFEKSGNFPKKQRFVLGQQIENNSLACIRLIIEANNARSPEETSAKLTQLNVELEVLRGLLRIAYEVRFLSTKSLAFITGRIDGVGKMCGGWHKRARAKLGSKEG